MSNTSIAEKKEHVKEIDTLEKWTEKKIFSENMAERLRKEGKYYFATKNTIIGKEAYKLAERIKNCANELQIDKCTECGHSHVTKAYLCREKICPVCTWRLARKRFAEMIRVLSYMDEHQELENRFVHFFTITLKNVKVTELRKTIKTMSESWKRFQELKAFKKNTWGWARSLEITYNKKAGTFHPHYHVLIISENGLTPEDNLKYQKLWKQSARIDYYPITDYREAYIKNASGATTEDGNKVISVALEALKYSHKTKQIEEMPLGRLMEYVGAVKGARMTSYGGRIKQIRAILAMFDNDENEEINETEVKKKCKICGKEAIELISKWACSEHEYKTMGICENGVI